MTHKNVFPFQFGLRAMLVGLTVSGVGLGILGKLYFTNYAVFYGIASGLVTIVPFLLAVGTVIRLGVKANQVTLTIWGLTLLLTPVVGMCLLFWLQTMAGPSMSGFGLMSNQRLIREIAKAGDGPPIWRELERRQKKGTLSSRETDEAIRQLVAFMKQRMPKGWNRPLTWQDDFVRAARAADAISQPVLLELCDEYFGTTPKLAPIDASRGGPLEVRLNFGTPWGRENHSGLDVSHLWTVGRVTVDGQEVEIERPHRFAQQWSGTTKGDLPSEPKELVASVEIAYVKSSKMIGIDDDDLSPDRWPTAIKRWTTEVRIPLDGTSPLQPKRVLTSVTDPARAPVGAVRIERLVAQQDEGGRQKLIVQLAFKNRVQIPLSFDISVQVDGQKHLLGGSWAASYRDQGSSGQMSGGSTFSSSGHLIDPVVRAADIVLIPNVEHLEKGLDGSSHRGTQDIDEFWGKPIVFPNTTLERLDLEIENSRNE